MNRCITTITAGALFLTVAIGAGAALRVDENVATEAEVCLDEGYAIGASEQMGDLAFIVGEWDLTIIATEGELEERIETTASFGHVLGGVGIKESMSLEIEDWAVDMATIITYDRFRDVYRAARLDSVSGLLDIFEGTMTDGVLTLENTKYDTTMMTPEGTRHSRLTYTKTSADGFEIDWSVSADGGTTWESRGTMVYTRS